MNEFDYQLLLNEATQLTTNKDKHAYLHKIAKVRYSDSIYAYKLLTSAVLTFGPEFTIQPATLNKINEMAGILLKGYVTSNDFRTMDDTFQFSENTNIILTDFRMSLLLRNKHLPYSLKYKMLKTMKG